MPCNLTDSQVLGIISMWTSGSGNGWGCSGYHKHCRPLLKRYSFKSSLLFLKTKNNSMCYLCFSSYGFAGDRSNNPNHPSFTKGKIFCFWLKRRLSQEQYYSLQSKTAGGAAGHLAPLPPECRPVLFTLRGSQEDVTPNTRATYRLRSWGTRAFTWVSFRASVELKGCHAKRLPAIY